MDKYVKAIKENICSICVDSSQKGFCTLNSTEVCAVQFYLPQIVEVIHSIENGSVQDYQKKLRETICIECRSEEERGHCHLREDANCSLDRYFGLIVETIKKVDSLQN